MGRASKNLAAEDLEVIEWICGVLFIFGVGLIVVGWLFWAVRRFVCGKEHKCRREDCPLRARGYCTWAVDSPADIERLKKMISELEEDELKK